MNLPSIFVSGGPMLSLNRLDLNSVFEAVGSYKVNQISEAELTQIEETACPGCGSCSGMFTANSMNCLSEAIGMALHGNGTVPAVYADRVRLAKQAGMQVMNLFEQDIKPSDILTEAAFHNALTVDMALGCSTNSVLHLLAIANECGVELNLKMINEISSKTPNLCHLAPAGSHHMQDLFAAGGVYAVINELFKTDLLNKDAMTVNGTTMFESTRNHPVLDHDVVRPIDQPYSKTGGLAVLFGNLAPNGAIVKRSAVRKRCCSLPAQPKHLTVRRTPSLPSTMAKFKKATLWSSVMKGRRAAPGCAKCSLPPQPLPVWGWTPTLR